MAKSCLLSSMCKPCRAQFLSFHARRAFSQTSHRRAADDPISNLTKAFDQFGSTQHPSSTDLFARALQKNKQPRPTTTRPAAPLQTPKYSADLQQIAENARSEAATKPGSKVSPDEPYHLNVYAHRHNIHITFTEPSRNPILSFSAGNIGLRKAQRGTFDAAYQLATYTFRKMAEKQWRTGGKKMTMNKMHTLADIKRPGFGGGNGIEVILRGYGPGREAFQKALLGTEGRMIKPLISKVTDGTRLKFGGTRSPQVRRLG